MNDKTGATSTMKEEPQSHPLSGAHQVKFEIGLELQPETRNCVEESEPSDPAFEPTPVGQEGVDSPWNGRNEGREGDGMKMASAGRHGNPDVISQEQGEGDGEPGAGPSLRW